MADNRALIIPGGAFGLDAMAITMQSIPAQADTPINPCSNSNSRNCKWLPFLPVAPPEALLVPDVALPTLRLLPELDVDADVAEDGRVGTGG